ncbi:MULTISPECIES: hypothetical protein [Stenotrophomonas]|uniref:hypothetical protein n=1 Tax=Stenotrophomonas TaxID=40323 RepID=UPI00131A5AC9|nr:MULTISPECIES: hypothetical protein [Stenotrophomonas]ELC7324558.1 hypothetical protein [Stenotrophomonas maltophilia]MBH1661894.1 hypothetical protein [Stenotrophomonas maltophilia]MBH1734435.1 hypothetical protein [Stenotrophomonas maltophilia]MBH1770428.1 hypothetical protein [Stenotrophomonas maltophilia]MDZ5834588.1 hypothetical protein [Stenotrophomonas maltophilia]
MMVRYVTCSGLSGIGVEVAKKIPINPGPVRLAMSVRPMPLSSLELLVCAATGFVIATSAGETVIGGEFWHSF